RVESKRRRVFVGYLQAKTAGLPKVSAQLLRPSSFALTVVVVLINPRLVEFVDDRVKVIVTYGKGKVAASISRLRHFAQLVHLVKNNALIRGNSDHGHAVFLLDQSEIQNTLVKTDAGLQVRGVEMQVVDSRPADSFGFGDFEKVSLGVLEDQSFVPTTTQSLFTLNVFHKGTRAADLCRHRFKFTFRDDKGMPRIRSGALALG